mgnify:CR=1 FL=1
MPVTDITSAILSAIRVSPGPTTAEVNTEKCAEKIHSGVTS